MWKMSWSDNEMQIQLALVVCSLISLTSVAAAADAKTAPKTPKYYVFFDGRVGGILPQGSWAKAYGPGRLHPGSYSAAAIFNLGLGFMEQYEVMVGLFDIRLETSESVTQRFIDTYQIRRAADDVLRPD